MSAGGGTPYHHSLTLLAIYKKSGYEAVSAKLNELQIPYMNAWAFVYRENLDKLQYVSDHLDDEYSKQVFRAVLMRNLLHNDEWVRDIYCGDQYFAVPQFNLVSPNTVYVDCGAFVGDTLEEFIRRNLSTFRHYFAFEPSPKAFRAMMRRCARLCDENAIDEQSIILENKGVGKTDNTFRLSVNPTVPSGNCVINGGADIGVHVPMISLDDYFARRVVRVTCIKADIEGAEYDMLLGAKKLIQEDRPNLAISIYHDMHDLFRIPLLIHELVPEYKMAIRHHSVTNNETILYCYV